MRSLRIIRRWAIHYVHSTSRRVPPLNISRIVTVLVTSIAPYRILVSLSERFYEKAWNYLHSLYMQRDYGARCSQEMIDTIDDPAGLSRRSRLTRALRMMFLFALCTIALSLGDHAIASSRVDDVIVRFIVNATPVLFPPSRVSLQLCISDGKIFTFVTYVFIVLYARAQNRKLNRIFFGNDQRCKQTLCPDRTKMTRRIISVVPNARCFVHRLRGKFLNFVV